MADQTRNKTGNDPQVVPGHPSQAEGQDLDQPGHEPQRPKDQKDQKANDEGKERGGRRSEQPSRPSTEGDMANPRTGRIG